jgi:mannose-6-phosphate isomerase class I
MAPATTAGNEPMAAASGGGGAAKEGDPAIEQLVKAYIQEPRPLALRCGVQHYGWGDRAFIPTLLGQPAPAERPHAELWIGAHHDLPAAVELGRGLVPLDRLIAAAPAALLGIDAARRHGGELPFLFKVLAAATPLSIQAHPNQAQAIRGFDDETSRGVAQGDPKRNYRDRNHKPELLVALTDFHALRGFRPHAEIAAELAGHPALHSLAAALDGTPAALRRLYGDFMRLPQPDVDALLAPVIADCRGRAEDTTDPGYERYRWLLHADDLFSADGHHDRGLLAFLLLNLLHLHPGQAIFLPAGELHSYLAGAGLELMANSNNVLRGGLTRKHIDVDALLDIVQVDPHAPEVCEPVPVADDPAMVAYAPPVTEFALKRLRLSAASSYPLQPPTIMLGLVLGGELVVRAAHGTLMLDRGGTFLLPAGIATSLHSPGGADVALATVTTQTTD